MTIKKTADRYLIESVQEELQTNPHRDYLNKVINEILEGRKCYLWGGAVRDPIIKRKYGRNGHINDFDVLVDDSEDPLDFRTTFKGTSNVFYNRFGTVKWKPVDGFDIDVSRFSNANMLRNGGRDKYAVSLETSLASCDFNTSAIAFDLADNTIYDNGALEGIEKQEIDLLEHAGDEPHVMMVRLILHSDKFGFTIGPRGNRLIAEGYSPKLDENIQSYLHYKNIGEQQEYLINRLRNVAQTDSK